MEYKYYTLYRPPMMGCQPSKGLLRVEDYGQRKRVTERTTAWGEVVYDRPLTEAEISDYELLKKGIG